MLYLFDSGADSDFRSSRPKIIRLQRLRCFEHDSRAHSIVAGVHDGNITARSGDLQLLWRDERAVFVNDFCGDFGGKAAAAVGSPCCR